MQSSVPPEGAKDERLFRKIFEASAIGIALVSPEGRPLRGNRALEQFLGYSEAELVRLSFTQFTHPDDVELDWSLYSELIAGKRSTYQIDKRYIRKDGQVVWGRLTVSLVSTEPLQVIGMVEDLTAKRESAAEQGRLVWTLGKRVKELQALHAVARLLNQYQHVSDLLPAVLQVLPPSFQHPNETEVQLRYGALRVQTERYTDSACRITSEFKLSDGSRLHIAVELGPPHTDPTLAFLPEEQTLIDSIADLLGGALDRHSAQERLELAVIGTGAGVWEWNFGTNQVLWSKQMETLAGLEQGSFERTFGAFQELLHPEDIASVTLAIDRAMNDNAGVFVSEFRLRRKDGSYRWFASNGQVFRGSDGKPYRMLGFATDCTERRTLEERLRQTQKLEAIGGLAGGVAHDFNNMLSVVVSYAELLLLDLEPNNPMRVEVQEIRTAAKRAGDLTRHLLAFSRQQVLEPRVFDLNFVLADLRRVLRRLVSEDVELWISPAQDLGRVHADPGQIEQVLINLVLNARDAMPTGGTLSIETSNVELSRADAAAQPEVAPGRYVLVTVTDTGVGMPRDVMSRVFEPFFTTKSMGKGAGLGLATVFGIVKQSGGHITVSSELGKGSTFRVHLPRADGAVQTSPVTSLTPRTLSGNETILLVEDEQQVRVLAAKILRRHGYLVLEAQNGGEALLICEQHAGKVHLLLTDVIMPLLSGPQLAERLSAMRAELKVLYMSGYTDDAVVRHGILTRGLAFLHKPLTPNELLTKVRALLDQGLDSTEHVR